MSSKEYKSLNFRQADPEDSEAVYGFICKLEQKKMDYETFKTRFREQVMSPSILLVLAENEGVPLGFLSCHNQNLLHHDGEIYEIVEFVVEEQSRGKGIGKKMMEYLEAQLKDKEYELIEVASNNSRDGAHRFYQQCGFKQSHYKFTKSKK